MCHMNGFMVSVDDGAFVKDLSKKDVPTFDNVGRYNLCAARDNIFI